MPKQWFASIGLKNDPSQAPAYAIGGHAHENLAVDPSDFESIVTSKGTLFWHPMNVSELLTLQITTADIDRENAYLTMTEDRTGLGRRRKVVRFDNLVSFGMTQIWAFLGSSYD